jgi:hypothetical protein
MGFRDQDSELSKDARTERLEDAVAKLSFRRFYETLQYGIQALLAGGGICLALFGGSFLMQECTVQEAQEQAHELAQNAVSVEDRAARQEAAEAPRLQAQATCATACENVGMAIQRARIAPEPDTEHFRAASCSCASENGSSRILWNDLVSRETSLRRQCRGACQEAGMGMQRAIVREGKLVACGCVSRSGHRTLFDDRRPPTCELATHEGIASCELHGYQP